MLCVDLKASRCLRSSTHESDHSTESPELFSEYFASRLSSQDGLRKEVGGGGIPLLVLLKRDQKPSTPKVTK